MVLVSSSDMRSTQFIRHVLVQIVASLNTSLFFQNRFFQCIVVDVYTMGTRKSSRSTNLRLNYKISSRMTLQQNQQHLNR